MTDRTPQRPRSRDEQGRARRATGSGSDPARDDARSGDPVRRPARSAGDPVRPTNGGAAGRARRVDRSLDNPAAEGARARAARVGRSPADPADGGRRSGTRADDPSGADPADEAIPSRARSSRRPPTPAAERVRSNGPGRWPVEVRSMVGSVLGLPPLSAVGLAAALTAVGVLVDLLRIGTLGTVFAICYVTGCVLGVAWVRRSALFWPMVVPPLLMAVAVPIVVLLTGTPKPGAGIAQSLLVIGAPLVNGFPMMAWTTGLVLGVGVLRLVTQRPMPTESGRAAARAEARTSESPRRS